MSLRRNFKSNTRIAFQSGLGLAQSLGWRCSIMCIVTAAAARQTQAGHFSQSRPESGRWASQAGDARAAKRNLNYVEEFNLEALQRRRRLVKQRGAANGRTTRQDGVLEKLRRAELEHAKRKEKATRQKQRVASLLASSASSSSDSSSDSSIEQ